MIGRLSFDAYLYSGNVLIISYFQAWDDKLAEEAQKTVDRCTFDNYAVHDGQYIQYQ